MGGGRVLRVVQWCVMVLIICFFFQAEDGIRDCDVTGVQTCALPIWIKVLPQGDGGACHVGFRSCFYRVVEDGRLVERPD